MKSRFQAITTVIAVNLLVLAVLVVAVELIMGRWLEQQVRCHDYLLHHSYCPGIVIYTSLSPEDGGGRIEYVVNRSRVRVADRSLKDAETDPSQYDIINVGDSFIEANKVPHDDTLGAVWGRLSGARILQFGHSSWAPVMYYNWLLRQKLKRGVIINLFVFVNDVAPVTGDSNADYHTLVSKAEDGAFPFTGLDNQRSIKNLVLQRSWFVEQAYALRHELGFLNSRFAEKAPEKWLEGDFSRPDSDCAMLDSLRGQFRGIPYFYTMDYLAFSFSSQCWNEIQKRSVESAIEDINRIREIVDRAGGKVNVLIVPPGWAFTGENLVGKTDRHYLMKEGTVITTGPLVEYMRARIRARVISLEDVIKKLKSQYPGTYYFPHDGHWTPRAHRHLGAWMYENLQ